MGMRRSFLVISVAALAAIPLILLEATAGERVRINESVIIHFANEFQGDKIDSLRIRRFHQHRSQKRRFHGHRHLNKHRFDRHHRFSFSRRGGLTRHHGFRNEGLRGRLGHPRPFHGGSRTGLKSPARID